MVPTHGSMVPVDIRLLPDAALITKFDSGGK